MKQKYSFLVEMDSEKNSNILANVGAAGAGLTAANLAIVGMGSPLRRAMTKDKNLISNLDYLNGLRVNDQKLQDYLRRRNISLQNSPPMPYYDPIQNRINMGLKDKYAKKYGQSVFAHELGHSVSLGQSKGKFALYCTSKILNSTAALAQLVNCFNNDDESRHKRAKIINAAGGISALPMIAEEINASIKGTRMLGLKGSNKVKAFLGIGSYITAAFSPVIIYTVSEKTRKFLKSLKKIKNENAEVNQNIDNLKQQNIKVKISE